MAYCKSRAIKPPRRFASSLFRPYALSALPHMLLMPLPGHILIRLLGQWSPDLRYGSNSCVAETVLLEDSVRDPISNQLPIAILRDFGIFSRVGQVGALAKDTGNFGVSRHSEPAPGDSIIRFAGTSDDRRLDSGCQSVTVSVPQEGLYTVGSRATRGIVTDARQNPSHPALPAHIPPPLHIDSST